MSLSKHGRSIAASVIGASVCISVCAHAVTTSGGQPASAVDAKSLAASSAMASIMSAIALPPNFDGDDPERVRDALAGLPAPGQAPSISNRMRAFLSHPFSRSPQGHAASETPAASQPLANARTDHTFMFVIPVSYGVRYLSKKKTLTVNVALAAPENPGAILLKQTVKGQSGRKLVVAPEAKEKGFIQTFDVIQLKPDDGIRTTVRGNTLLPSFDHAHGNGDFAIVLICTLTPPYLTDDVEHSAPTDEEPTDITRRTSTLNGRVDAAWLIDRKEGTIVTKRLRLVK